LSAAVCGRDVARTDIESASVTIRPHTARHPLVFSLIGCAAALGLAGTDLVLPAVPGLPRILGGTAERAQLVLAAFTAGAAAGLLLYGELGARFDQRRLLVASLAGYAAASAACSLAASLDTLILLRVVQGATSAAAAVFAPGMLRALYGDRRAVAAIGLLGSVEALAPALAPIAGVWLLAAFGWHGAFDTLAAVAAVLSMATLLLLRRLPVVVARSGAGGYLRLLGHRAYLRQALSHAFTLGALLVIVFGAPTVFVRSMGAGLDAFIAMQISSVSAFIVAANVTGRLIPRFGAERLILGGTGLATAGALAILGYALSGGNDTRPVIGLFALLSIGLGLRGPPGFHAAIVAADDDARGAALLIVAILLTAAIGTAAVAPFIGAGLISIATGGAIFATAASLMLALPSADPIEMDQRIV
jgi:predicted MFS family arabinose efflux permease